MNQTRLGITALALSLTMFSCTSYNAFQKAKHAETSKDWDAAVIEYQKALDVDPSNALYRINLSRAKLEASRLHFEKGKDLRTAAANAHGADLVRLLQLAATELEIVIRLDPTNQFAANEYSKTVVTLQDIANAGRPPSIDEIKRRAKANITKSAPPQLSPTSDQPISLSFPQERPIKEIYRALGNAFGINILFDQAVKDDRIAIELKDVTAQQALERVMQAANHFYKALDEHTIIVVPDNPQARRDYEDLVIRTFYLSNGDAEQVTNVVRTMIEARNVFPLKALNAITIRDTADKVRIAEKIIEANDKARAEVVVDVELLQIDLDKQRDMGAVVSNLNSTGNTIGITGTVTANTAVDSKGAALPTNLDTLRGIRSSDLVFNIPTVSYAFVKSVGNTQTLANPELRISEGEKATLHIGQRVPVPVTTFTTGVQGSGTVGSLPATSFQYQDVGIKVSIEPRVHHNNEVTLKLTVEVSDIAAGATADAPPSFNTRTIEATIRLKDGETNFLAGLIQDTEATSSNKTPFLGDIPILGRLFTKDHTLKHRTDLMLTMTPHIIRKPDITEDDLAPMWVGTQSNLSFRGLSPRLESQSTADPFSTPPSAQQFRTGTVDSDGNPVPQGAPNIVIPQGSAPANPFNPPTPNSPPVNPQPQPEPQSRLLPPTTGAVVAQSVANGASNQTDNSGLAPRIEPQPMRMAFKPGEEKMWNVIGMDLEGLSATQLLLHYNPQTLDVSEVVFGPALTIDIKTPPIATIDREHGTVRISSSNGKPLQFNSGSGEIVTLRVRGGAPGETYLVLENPNLTNGGGTVVAASVSGGHAKVD